MTQQAEAIAPARTGRPIPGPRGHPILGSIREIQRDNVHFRGSLPIDLLVHPDSA
jgi:hypothetical protein